ncbi:NAD-binding protein [Dehalococcoidia bacterium]|nr:NAD-binding protein [Dehalococcoidia bacterium]
MNTPPKKPFLKRIANKISSEIRAAFLILIFVLTFGSLSFAYFEGIRLFDAVYWVFVTITTVGFGDIAPVTVGGRVTFFFVALGGIGTIALVLEQLISLSTKQQFRRMLGLNKIKLQKHIIIVGYNEVTEEIIKTFQRVPDKDFIVILREHKNVSQAELDSKDITYIIGNVTHHEIYERANISEADTLIVSTEDDAETLMIALVARRVNKDINIIASCLSRDHVDMMRQANINHIVSSSEIDGILLSNAITEPVVTSFITNAISLEPGLDFKQIIVEREQRLSEIKLRSNERVIALQRESREDRRRFVIHLHDDEMLHQGDCLILITDDFE